jgi:hypothetical protein
MVPLPSPRRLQPAVALALAALVTGCSETAKSAGDAANTTPASNSSKVNEPSGPAWFEDLTPGSGVDFVHVSGHQDTFLMPEIMGGGGALFDMDNDGDLDLYLVQSGSLHEPTASGGANQLYRNNGDGTFENITQDSGADNAGYGMGAAAGDYNNDGYIDLYITNVGANTLLRNNGDSTFTDVTQQANVGHQGWGTSALFLDYDRDGHLDLFATNYLNWSLATELDCYNHMGGKDYCSPQNYNAPAMDVLYRNNGDGTFTDVSAAAGLSADFGTGLGCVAADFNNDGWLDIFVANDGMKDQLWVNMRNGTFIDAALRTGCAVDLDGTEKAGMGVAVADLDDDADPDLIVCNLNQQSDSLYRNDNGYFADVTAIAGLGAVSRPFTRFGMGWHDFDHDGLLDLYQVNGRVMQQAELYADDPYAEPNLLFRGTANFKFEEVKPRGGTHPMISANGRAGLFGDIDNDGDTDIIVVNINGSVHIMRNVAPKQGEWITFSLVDAQGHPVEHAIVSVQLGERRIYRESRSGSSYLAANDPRINIGLANATIAQGTTVRWPDGTIESFGDLGANQFITLRKGAGQPLQSPQ